MCYIYINNVYILVCTVQTTRFHQFLMKPIRSNEHDADRKATEATASAAGGPLGTVWRQRKCMETSHGTPKWP